MVPAVDMGGSDGRGWANWADRGSVGASFSVCHSFKPNVRLGVNAFKSGVDTPKR